MTFFFIISILCDIETSTRTNFNIVCLTLRSQADAQHSWVRERESEGRETGEKLKCL